MIAPLEALTDDRLTDPERRVLLALYSFRGKNTNTVWPKLDALAGRCHIKDTTRISKVTTALAKKGWLSKKRRGFTGLVSYEMTIPEDCAYMAPETMNDLGDNEPRTNMAQETKNVNGTEGHERTWHEEPTVHGTTDQLYMAPDTKNKEHYIEQTNEQTIERGAKRPPTTRKKFVKPTVDEIQSYITERKSSVSAQRFFDYNESKGWVVGKSPMKDWKAAVRTWEQNENARQNKPSKHSGFSERDYSDGATRPEDIGWLNS